MHSLFNASYILIVLGFLRKILRMALPQEDDPFVLYMMFRGSKDNNIYALPVAKSPYCNALMFVKEEYKKIGWTPYLSTVSRIKVDAQNELKNAKPIHINWSIVMEDPTQYLYDSNFKKLYEKRTKQYPSVTML